MLVALRLVDGPTVLSLTRLPSPDNDSPEVCAIRRALDCVLDADMHVAVETSWGRAVFRLREDDDALWLGLYPCVTIHRHTRKGRAEIHCMLGQMSSNAILECLHVLHPLAWTVAGGETPGSPVVLSVAVVVEHRHEIWPAAA